MTPMPSVPKSLKGYENYRLYQVSRVEDGRHRYRLRLGFFASEADAEIAVASLRTLYPAAFTSRAGNEDMRYSGDPLLTGRFEARPTSSTVSDATPPKPAGKPPEPRTARPITNTTAAAQPAPVGTAKPAVSKPEPASTRTSSTPALGVTKPAATMSLLDPPPAPVKHHERSTPYTMTTHQPFHVARGVDLPDTDLELEPTLIPVPNKQNQKQNPQWTHSSAAAPKAAPTAAAKPKAAAPSLPVGKPTARSSSAPVNSAAANATAARKPAGMAQAGAGASVSKPAIATPVAKTIATQPIAKASPPKSAETKASDDYIPILDTTMTIRTISIAEMEDANQEKWFSVQLAVSEQAFNLDAMPRLDIFAAYRLYSVAVKEDAKLKHSLRLGFFKEEVSAEAVSGYLKTFFPAPTITRISVAEYDRFIEPKEPEPKQESKVVKLEEKREQTHSTAPAKPTFGVNPAPPPPRSKQAKPARPKWNTEKPGYRSGPSGKYSIESVKEKQTVSRTADSGNRGAAAQRPQSFFSKLIGRELD